MTARQFYRLRLELPAMRELRDAQLSIEATYGQHPYLYPPIEKARWMELNAQLMADAMGADAQ